MTEQDGQRGTLIDRINNSSLGFRLRIIPEVDGVTLKIPNKETVLEKYPDSETIKELVELLYTGLLEAPLLDYEGIFGTDKEIRQADEEILALFEAGSTDQNYVEKKILTKNRYRVNSLISIDLLLLISSELGKSENIQMANYILEIYNSVNTLHGKTGKYKESPKETKNKYVRQHTKAVEMALCVLMGEKIGKEEIIGLKELNSKNA
ncbi:MAG: hypothetical protein AAB656_00205 [Patescibacteria group bacterium]